MFLLICNRGFTINKYGRYLASSGNDLKRNQDCRGKSCLHMIKLVAAGKGITIAHPLIMRHILSLSRKELPNIIYLGTPSKDSNEHWKSTGLPYSNRGFPVTRIQLWNTTQDEKAHLCQTLKKVIFDADIILVSGGSTRDCIMKWKEFGVDKLLLSAAKKVNSPVLAGGSAGALCWFGGHGLGLIPSLFVPHFDVGFLKPNKTGPEEKLGLFSEYSNCICVDENAAVLISSTGLSFMQNEGSYSSTSNHFFSSLIYHGSSLVRRFGKTKPRGFLDAEITVISIDGKAKGFFMRRESIPKLEPLEIGQVKRFSDLVSPPS